MREQIAVIILNHWPLEMSNTAFPTYVKCAADYCGWEGRFPAEISVHCADLIMDLIKEPARQPQRNSPTDWPDVPRLP